MEPATQAQVKKLVVLMSIHMIDRKEFKKRLHLESTKELSKDQISAFIEYYENLPVIVQPL